MPELEDIVYSDDDEDVSAEADMNNLDAFIPMDVKGAFLYGKIKEEVYVYQPPGFEDLDFPDRVTKFQRGQIDKPLFIKRDQRDILIVQVYVDDIILGSTKKKLCTEFEKMMYKKFLMSSMGELTFFLGLQVKQKEDGIFISQDKFQVNPKVSHLYAMKRIFRYLKGQPKLGLWYPKDLPFNLVAYTDSHYVGASLDRKSTTGGCQFLGCRLISWQCKKQTVVANSTTEVEYVAALSCCGQIRHHFIRDSNEKKLIQMIKIHTDKNVADLLTKAFDVNGNVEWKRIGVNAGNSKLMLLGIKLLLLVKVNAARHNLLLMVVKTVNGEVQLQALVDGKKVIITETSVRRDLQLEDAEGIACLPNADIFEQLALMGYEKPSQKLTFYKAFFSPQWKFLIHTILQCLIFLNQQAGDMSNHKRIYVTPSHTKKVFGNMKREGKGFSGRVTPLFPTMMVQAQEEMGEGSANPTDPHHTPIITQPSTSKPQKKQKPRKPKRKDTKIPQSSGPNKSAVKEGMG
ncbi:putative ribonuclease H-like domain-containing protein [Tanacetum coccineum]